MALGDGDAAASPDKVLSCGNSESAECVHEGESENVCVSVSVNGCAYACVSVQMCVVCARMYACTRV